MDPLPHRQEDARLQERAVGRITPVTAPDGLERSLIETDGLSDTQSLRGAHEMVAALAPALGVNESPAFELRKYNLQEAWRNSLSACYLVYLDGPLTVALR